MCVFSPSVGSDSLWPHGLYPARLLCLWGFSRQEYWGGLPCPPPGDLPNPGIEPRSLILQVDSLPSEPPGKPMKSGVGSIPSPRDIPNPRIELESSSLQTDSLLALSGKPMYGVLLLLLLLFSNSVVSDSLQPHGLQHARLPCPNREEFVQTHSLWCHPTISFSVIPFSSCLLPFPPLGCFLMSWLFASGGCSHHPQWFWSPPK